LQTVLITGASEGMGKSVAKQLAQKGASIIIVARNVGKLEEALDEIKASSLLPPVNNI
jgi:3-dehydrosphinganine reductase